MSGSFGRILYKAYHTAFIQGEAQVSFAKTSDKTGEAREYVSGSWLDPRSTQLPLLSASSKKGALLTTRKRKIPVNL